MRFRSGGSYVTEATIKANIGRRLGQIFQWLEAESGGTWEQPDNSEIWVENNWKDFTPAFPADAFEQKYGITRDYAYTKLVLSPTVAVKQAKQRKRDNSGTLVTAWMFVEPSTGATSTSPIEGDLGLGQYVGPYATAPNNGEFRAVLGIKEIGDGDVVGTLTNGFYDPVTNKTYGYTEGGGYRAQFQNLDTKSYKLDDLDNWATEAPILIVGQPYFKRRGQWQKSKMGVGWLLKTKNRLKIETGNYASRSYVQGRTNAGMTPEDAEKIDTLKTSGGYLYFSPVSSNSRIYLRDPAGILMKKYIAINWPFTTITRALYDEES